MKRVWMTQQQPFDFMPLKAGLGMITEDELNRYSRYFTKFPLLDPPVLCPKIYTTRTRRMSGEYQVVRGSRFKAKPLDPPIEFQVKASVPFDLKDLSIPFDDEFIESRNLYDKHYTIPELDLGIVGTTAEVLRDELLKLNKKATVATPYYINKLEPIN